MGRKTREVRKIGRFDAEVFESGAKVLEKGDVMYVDEFDEPWLSPSNTDGDGCQELRIVVSCWFPPSCGCYIGEMDQVAIKLNDVIDASIDIFLNAEPGGIQEKCDAVSSKKIFIAGLEQALERVKSYKTE